MPNDTAVKWVIHAQGCDKCRLVNLESSRTFVFACAEGSPKLRDELAKIHGPKQRVSKPRSEFYATKKQVQAAMKYKEAGE